MSTITLTQKKCIFFLSVNSSIKPYLSEAYKPSGPFPYHTALPSGDARRFTSSRCWGSVFVQGLQSTAAGSFSSALSLLSCVELGSFQHCLLKILAKALSLSLTSLAKLLQAHGRFCLFHIIWWDEVLLPVLENNCLPVLCSALNFLPYGCNHFVSSLV